MRDATERLFGLIDSGRVTHVEVASMCVAYMSDSDVASMLDANELSERFDETVDTDEPVNV
jgi:hypothetical protein